MVAGAEKKYIALSPEEREKQRVVFDIWTKSRSLLKGRKSGYFLESSGNSAFSLIQIKGKEFIDETDDRGKGIDMIISRDSVDSGKGVDSGMQESLELNGVFYDGAHIKRKIKRKTGMSEKHIMEIDELRGLLKFVGELREGKPAGETASVQK